MTGHKLHLDWVQNQWRFRNLPDFARPCGFIGCYGQKKRFLVRRFQPVDTLSALLAHGLLLLITAFHSNWTKLIHK